MFAWINRIDHHFPIRYSAWALCMVGFVVCAYAWARMGMDAWLAIVFLGLVLLGVRDTRQTRHSILRNYPVIGHLRFLFAGIGYEWINHSLQPTVLKTHDFRVTIGETRAQPYSASLFNISAMSFGALSANAILALNAGAKRGNFAHDTGEGSISRHHRVNGGDLIWEVGSGYFGCCNDDGSFCEERFAANALDPQVKMIEVKLSQGAKPGHGGVLPGPKVTLEIAEARGVQPWVDCVSPASHSAFRTPIEMMHFIERLRTLSGGKPTGFNCPTGVTTQDPQRQKAISVPTKADRVFHFHQNTLLALKELVQAAGLGEPGEITASHIVRRNSEHGVKLLANLLPFVQRGELLDGRTNLQVFRTYWPMASASSFTATPA
jgi:hypothetical protein